MNQLINLIIIVYSIIAVIWFDWLCHHFYATDRKGKDVNVYNDKIMLVIVILISLSWIISVPIYIMPLRRKFE